MQRCATGERNSSHQVSWQPWQPLTCQEDGLHLKLPHQTSVHGPHGQVGLQSQEGQCSGVAGSGGQRHTAPQLLGQQGLGDVPLDGATIGAFHNHNFNQHGCELAIIFEDAWNCRYTGEEERKQQTQ